MRIQSIQANPTTTFRSRESYQKLFLDIFETRFHCKEDIYKAFNALKKEIDTVPDLIKNGETNWKKLRALDFTNFFKAQKSQNISDGMLVNFMYPVDNSLPKGWAHASEPASENPLMEVNSLEDAHKATFYGFDHAYICSISFGIDNNGDIVSSRVKPGFTQKYDIYYKEDKCIKPRVSVDYFEACDKIEYLERYDKEGNKLSNFSIYLKQYLRSWEDALIHALSFQLPFLTFFNVNSKSR